jgi:YebC/PmpR family DNA-binding regulatory protein
MAGHSKWANIKIRKGAQDAKRGKAFSKLSRNITVAVKEGGDTNPDNNSMLRLAIEKAKESNMPKDKIQKAIERGSGSANTRYEEVTYEGYFGPGVAIVVKAATDNKNRTASEIRQVFGEYNVTLGALNSASYLFTNGAPTYSMPLDEENTEMLKSFIEDLEDLEEVVSIAHNASI